MPTTQVMAAAALSGLKIANRATTRATSAITPKNTRWPVTAPLANDLRGQADAVDERPDADEHHEHARSVALGQATRTMPSTIAITPAAPAASRRR